MKHFTRQWCSFCGALWGDGEVHNALVEATVGFEAGNGEIEKEHKGREQRRIHKASAAMETHKRALA